MSDVTAKIINVPQVAELLKLTPLEISILIAKKALPEPSSDLDGEFFWDRQKLRDFLQEFVNKRKQRGQNNPDFQKLTIDTMRWRTVFSRQLGGHQTVLRAISEICEQAMFATREDVVCAVDIPLQSVNEAIKKLHEQGLIRRIRPGIYTIIREEAEPRAISLTHLPDGTSKLEFGDVCETITASERRRLAQLLVGDAMQFSNLQAGHDANLLAQELFLVTNMLRTADSERRAALVKAGVDVPLMPWAGVAPHMERFARNLEKTGATY